MARVESVELRYQLSPSAAVIVGLPLSDLSIDSRFISSSTSICHCISSHRQLSEAVSALVVCQELLKAGLFMEGQAQEFYAKVFLLHPTHGGHINAQ